jgi:outer membrane protein OmpA-like peptidoglycan-associated protein
VGAIWTAAAWAQASATSSGAQEASASPSDSRPATTTFDGDTGLWFVPTAEVLAHGAWSVSAYRRGTNEVQGFSNVSDIAGTFAIGVGDRTELVGSFVVDTRIDRDLRPIFSRDRSTGGLLARYPRMTSGWTGDHVGDFSLGAKVNLWSAFRGRPAALAVRALVKLPTGDEDAGVSTGKADGLVDFIVSRETASRIELSGYAGYAILGKPEGFGEAPRSAFRWGVGGGFPSRAPVRGLLEANGFVPSSDRLVVTTPPPPPIGFDGSIAPNTSDVTASTRATAGVTWVHRSGFFLGGALSWTLPRKDRSGFVTDSDPLGDFVDWQIRFGYHPGVRVYVPPSPPPPQPPPPPPLVNRPPTVTARCEPCTVEAGKTSTLTADAVDEDGDVLTYRWSAPVGTFQNPADRQTVWTAPAQPGPVQATVTVSDGKGGTASAPVTLQVMPPPPLVELSFEDVYFDFDRSTLRPDALRLLDDAAATLQANPGRNIVIEGHTCNIGTAEYNLALGERRAAAVRDYLTSRGVPASRLETRSYGEERPKHDNAREETRRLNRRAALVVRVQ